MKTIGILMLFVGLLAFFGCFSTVLEVVSFFHLL